VGYFAQVVLDDIDITEFAIEGSVTTRLNRVGQATVKVHMTDAYASFGTMYPGPGSYLKIYFYGDNLGSTPVLWHHGRVINCETTADENVGYTVFNSYDPLELWQYRPVRNPPGSDPGNFAKPNIIQSLVYAPAIVEGMMDGSELNTIPQDSEGPLRLQRGFVAQGSTPMTADPSDWPMTMMELANLLISSGKLDVVITPIEFDVDGNYGAIDLYNGDYGQDLTGSVTLSYGMGDRNVRALRWNEDMTQMCNKLWYFLGPKCDEEHWRANVQGDDPAFNPDGVVLGPWNSSTAYAVNEVVTHTVDTINLHFICKVLHVSSGTTEPGVGGAWNSVWDLWFVPPGGRLTGPCGSASSTNNPIGVRSCQSRETYDVRMDIKIFDAAGDDTDCSDAVVIGHELYRINWQIEQYLRAVPITLIHVTPIRDFGIGLFTIGDLITVEASPDVKGGFSGAQRVYEYTIDWDEDSVPAIGELQVSSDNEGV